MIGGRTGRVVSFDRWVQACPAGPDRAQHGAEVARFPPGGVPRPGGELPNERRHSASKRVVDPHSSTSLRSSLPLSAYGRSFQNPSLGPDISGSRPAR